MNESTSAKILDASLPTMTLAELKALSMKYPEQYNDIDKAIAWELLDRLLDNRITDIK